MKAINTMGKNVPLAQSRNTLSQTVILARKYGGPTYKRVASAIIQKERQASPELARSPRITKSTVISPSMKRKRRKPSISKIDVDGSC